LSGHEIGEFGGDTLVVAEVKSSRDTPGVAEVVSNRDVPDAEVWSRRDVPDAAEGDISSGTTTKSYPMVQRFWIRRSFRFLLFLQFFLSQESCCQSGAVHLIKFVCWDQKVLLKSPACILTGQIAVLVVLHAGFAPSCAHFAFLFRLLHRSQGWDNTSNPTDQEEQAY
jgi:hypothetical protein